MKKQLLLLAASVVSCSVLAQGTVTLNNANEIIRVDGAGAPASANARTQLAWAPAGSTITAWVPGQSLSGWLTANPALKLETLVINVGTPLPGRFFGGTVTLTTGTPGADVTGYMVAWSGGTTAFPGFDAAAASPNGRIGISSPFAINTGNPNATPAPEAPGDILALQPFNLAPAVPEPTSFALLGLGAAAMLIFRRRS